MTNRQRELLDKVRENGGRIYPYQSRALGFSDRMLDTLARQGHLIKDADRCGRTVFRIPGK